jgi:Arc/MetJ-type ribon-helix-helix transcriptional regulator
MSTVEIPDNVKAIIERHVAEGRIASEADFLVEATRFYDSYLEDEEAIVVAAQEGIAAIERGDYVTIANANDEVRFWDGVWADAKAMVGRRDDETGASDPE